MTLRTYLIVLIGAVMVATLVFGSVATYLHARSKVDTEMEAAIGVGGRIARNAVDDVEEMVNAKRRLELLVADFDGDRHLRAEVLDPAGKVILSSKLATSSDPVPEWFYSLLSGEPRTVDVALPAAFDGQGRLVLRTDSRNEVSEVWDDMLNTLTILFTFCGMILGLVYLTIGRALGPLESLATAFAEIGERGFAVQLPEAGPIELKRVYHGFNEMVSRLAKAQEQNGLLQEQLTTVQEEERAEIARDLHDEIGPFLFSADVDATAVQQLVADDPRSDVRDRALRIRESVSHMQKQVRDILSRLRAGPHAELGLALAVENLILFWRGRCPDIAIEADIAPESFTETIDSTIFRVIQEAVSNSVKHGKPSRIGIAVHEAAGSVSVSVVDDGVGLTPRSGNGGFGIRGMKERLSLQGGTFEVATRTDRSGVIVNATIPLRPSHDPGSNSLGRHEAISA